MYSIRFSSSGFDCHHCMIRRYVPNAFRILVSFYSISLRFPRMMRVMQVMRATTASSDCSMGVHASSLAESEHPSLSWRYSLSSCVLVAS
jgi:hypothetical protein